MVLQDKIGVPVINVKKTTKYDLQIKLEYFISHSFILFQKSLNSLKRVKSFNLQTKSLNVRALLLMLYSRGGHLVFDWDRLENFLITRDRPGGYKVTNTKYHEMQRFSFLFTF